MQIGAKHNNLQLRWCSPERTSLIPQVFVYLRLSKTIFVGKCKQSNFQNLCVKKPPVEHSTSCDPRINLNNIKLFRLQS